MRAMIFVTLVVGCGGAKTPSPSCTKPNGCHKLQPAQPVADFDVQAAGKAELSQRMLSLVERQLKSTSEFSSGNSYEGTVSQSLTIGKEVYGWLPEKPIDLCHLSSSGTITRGKESTGYRSVQQWIAPGRVELGSLGHDFSPYPCITVKSNDDHSKNFESQLCFTSEAAARAFVTAYNRMAELCELGMEPY